MRCKPGAGGKTVARQRTMGRQAGSSCSSTFFSTERCPRPNSRSYLHANNPPTLKPYIYLHGLSPASSAMAAHPMLAAVHTVSFTSM